ncbi:MAG TPA: UbiA prenyltransferase family protein [Candidatus Nanoarchaeia archaeon]|nr:UbiA prenyltransferase family protein [Candidatus Nanoarchaeia archaeon]
MGVFDWVKVMRPEQWYKNLLVFLAVFFSFNLFNFNKLALSFFGFIILIILSSANYAVNDITDRKNDLQDVSKKSRLIASRKVPVRNAAIFSIILFSAGLYLSYLISLKFFLLMLLFVVLSTAYSFYLKKEIFADILLISVNFAIRAAAGAVIINVYISPWLILCPFFLSLFLSVGKRRVELADLGKKAAMHRNTLAQYTQEMTTALMIITTTILIIAYTFYTLTVDHELMFTVPVVLYALFRYFQFVYSNSKIARNPELALTDRRFAAALILWTAITFAVLYY